MSGEDQPDRARSIALIGAPIEVGTSEAGALMGPAALRTAGLVRALAELGHAIADRGDVARTDPPGRAGWTVSPPGRGPCPAPWRTPSTRGRCR